MDPQAARPALRRRIPAVLRNPVAGAAAAAVAVVCLLAGYTTYAVDSSQHRACAGVRELAGRRPPAGNPAVNPSRAYLQGMHRGFMVISRAEGCG